MPNAVSIRGITGFPTSAAETISAADSAFGNTIPATFVCLRHRSISAEYSAVPRAFTRTKTADSGFVARKRSRAARASSFAPAGTASSRSTITAAAPEATALGMRSGFVAGTKSMVVKSLAVMARLLLTMDRASDDALINKVMRLILAVAQFTENRCRVLAQVRNGGNGLIKPDSRCLQ